VRDAVGAYGTGNPHAAYASARLAFEHCCGHPMKGTPPPELPPIEDDSVHEHVATGQLHVTE
jgi:hypothetical protein